MGEGVEVSSKHQFLSQSSGTDRHFVRAIVASKKRPVDIHEIVDIIEEAHSVDPFLHQHIVTSAENIGDYHKEYKSAANLCLGALRCIANHDINDALELGYTIPHYVYDYRIHRTMIRLHNKLGQYKISNIHLDCLDGSWATLMRDEIKDNQDIDDTSKQYLIFKQLAKSLENEFINNKEQDVDLEDSTNLRHHPVFDIPVIAWEWRSLLKRMTARDLQVKYQKSILGWFWAVIEPLALTLTFLFLFEVLSSKPEQYRPLNIMIGIMVWSSFGYIMNRGTKFLEGNTGIIKKVSIPKQIFLLNIAGTAMFTLLINLLAIIPLLIYYKLIPTYYLLYLPISILLVSIYSIGLTLFTSTLQAKWRDVNQFVVVAVRIGFYFSPVFYTMSMLSDSRIPPDYLTAYLLLNPIAIFLSMARSAFTSTPLGIEPWIVACSVLHVLFLFIAGSIWFRNKEDMVVKYL